MPSWANVGKEGTQCRQQALGLSGRFEPVQATLALAHRPAQVFTALVERAALAVLDTRQHLTFGCPIAL